MCVIRPAQRPAFVAALPVKCFHGVGPVTAAKMVALGIITGADLRDFGFDALSRHLGSSASYFHRAAHGDDDRPVRLDRAPKSVGAERTFDRNLTAEADLLDALSPVIDAVWRRIERAGVAGRTLTLKVKFADFSVISRAATRTLPIATRDVVAETGAALLRRMRPVDQGYVCSA